MPAATVVDLPRIRMLLAELGAHLDAYPEIQDRTAAMLAGELNMEENMSLTTPVGIRLDDAMTARVDRFAADVRATMPGLRMTRSEALRTLVIQALDAWEAKKAKGSPHA